MATTNRRPVLSLTPRGVSLEEWESKAPLKEEELQCVGRVKDGCLDRRLPPKFLSQLANSQTPHGSPSRPSTPQGARSRNPTATHAPKDSTSLLLQTLLRSPSVPRSLPPTRPSTPPLQSSSLANTNTTLSISTPQQFYDWFSLLTSSLEHEQDALYRDHLAEIGMYREACDRLVGECKEAERVCKEMGEAFGFVEERSKSLQEACEELLEEQNRLLETSDNLAHRLSYFASLEPAIRTLNSPGESLVTSAAFIPMVERIDECLSYLKSHRDFRDAELYIIRYQQCQTRSMTLIKMYFLTQVKLLGQDVARRMADRNLADAALHALLYTKPTLLAPPLRSLILELEHRSSSTSLSAAAYRAGAGGADDLAPLLGECHSAWVAMRQAMLQGVVMSEVGRLNPAKAPLVELTRAGCGYLKQLCSDEFNLFGQFFSTGEDRLHSFLETLCDHLYDYLRPRILHEPSLTVLCQVCTVLQALMVLDADEDSSSETSNSPPTSPLLSPTSHLQLPSPSSQLSPRTYFQRSILVEETNRKKKLEIKGLLAPVLQDAQTRLVFRAQAVLQNGVGRFSAGEGDLDYPEKLEKAVAKARERTAAKAADAAILRAGSTVDLDNDSAIVSEDEEKEKPDDDDDDDGALFRLPSLEVQETWYPSLRKTLGVLAELHNFIDAAIFEDVAQEAVTLCRQSLFSASEALRIKKGEVDGALFLVRHLLILKEMLGSVEMVRRDMGGGMLGVTEAFSALLASALSFLPTALTFGYGATVGRGLRMNQHMEDAKVDLDRSLKSSCEDLITYATLASTAPTRAFLLQANSYLSGSAPGSRDLAAQPWATPEKVLEVHEEVRKSVRRELKQWLGQLRMYLEDRKAVEVLIPPTQSSIVDAYRPFHDLVRAEYNFAVSGVVLSPLKMWDFLRTVVLEEEEESDLLERV
ncbi:Sec34-like family-domain-containing protein [Mrakia frigida]|uniref:Golgi transport complex subunit COG3 n=1 Tax=Mrakia frigida TaxID=29902 RepID=UPI003FCBFD3A